MKYRPILFSAPMVRAILDGRKTQTRRVIKNAPDRFLEIEEKPGSVVFYGDNPTNYFGEVNMNDWRYEIRCPYGVPGDRLWVKETWATDFACDDVRPVDLVEESPLLYRADESARGIVAFGWGRWRQSIFMPRWASRLTLEIASVRIDWLNDISEEDAKAEGADIMMQCKDGCWIVCGPRVGSYREGYRWLWESINGHGSWAANPLVWVVEFKRIGGGA